jgi:two-component system KDP operon response regulator KdpE
VNGEPTILIIDDDTVLLALLKQALERAGFHVELANNGLTGLQRAYEVHPDLVILDVMMPRMDGWEVCSRLRQISFVPIIMLTAKDEEQDKLRGFALGVDDYVTKPFSFAELIARINAVLHRARATPVEHPSRPPVTIGDLTIDVDNLRVSKKGKPVSLTPTEFKLLAVLVENAGRIMTHQQLLDHVWGPTDAGDEGYVKRYIWYLRQKLEDDPNNPRYILTERGFGYSFRRS